MAMNDATLGALIKTKIAALTSVPGDPTYELNVWVAVAEAIVSHIQNNAKVQTGIALSASGSNVAGPVASTGATTAEGTIQ